MTLKPITHWLASSFDDNMGEASWMAFHEGEKAFQYMARQKTERDESVEAGYGEYGWDNYQPAIVVTSHVCFNHGDLFESAVYPTRKVTAFDCVHFVDEEPVQCRAIIQFNPGYGTVETQCVLDAHSDDEEHLAASPIHETGTGVLVHWLGDDRARTITGKAHKADAHMIRWADEVTGDEVGPEDPRLIPYEI
jgi:hypothetical protein